MMKLDKSILAFLLLSVTVQAANINIQWSVQTYQDITAQVGDTITFTWGSGHSVYINPSGSCDTQGAILVGDTPPAVYTFTADDANKDLFFACGVPGHCAAGQSITVAVAAAGVSAPSSAPVASSTSAAPTVSVAGGANSTAVPTGTVGGGMVTPAPTPFETSNETVTGTEPTTTAPMEGENSTTMAPSSGGGSGTEAPDGGSGAMRVPIMAGLATGGLAMGLAWLME
jgi:hypothetical protein